MVQLFRALAAPLDDQGSSMVSDGGSQQDVTSVLGALSSISGPRGHQGHISYTSIHNEQNDHSYKVIFKQRIGFMAKML